MSTCKQSTGITLTAWSPLRPRDAVGRFQSEWTPSGHVSSNDEMHPRMWPTDILNVRLKADEIFRKRAHSMVHHLFSKRRVDHQPWFHS